MTLRSLLVRVPVIGSAAIAIRRRRRARAFPGSSDFWEDRYRHGGTSGAGSYGVLAEYKAGFLNDFVQGHGVSSVVELGSGDGSQLELAAYPRYLGLDISPTAVDACARRYGDDPTKVFELHQPGTVPTTAELALSLDVIYHLVEDGVFETYMADLFDVADRWVIVYSSNTDRRVAAPHVRHRRFTDWIDRERPRWALTEHIPNPHKAEIGQESATSSFADFYVFERR